jgi:hypothetical protein
VDGNQLFQGEYFGIRKTPAASQGAKFAENRHGQIPFS